MMPESNQFGDESENPVGEHVSEEQQADEMLFEQYLAEEEDLSLPERGDLREGIVVEVRSNELLVNIGAKRDGVVPQSDLSRLDSDYADTLGEGETVPGGRKQTYDHGRYACPEHCRCIAEKGLARRR